MGENHCVEYLAVHPAELPISIVMPQDICSDNRLCRLDLGNIGRGLGAHVAAAGGDFDLEIIYVNSAGTRSTIVLGFTC